MLRYLENYSQLFVMVEISSIFNFSTPKLYMNGSARGRQNAVIPVLLPVGKVIYLTASHVYACTPQLVAHTDARVYFRGLGARIKHFFIKMMIFLDF